MKQIYYSKKTTSVWGYVNTLKDIETDEYYSCRIFRLQIKKSCCSKRYLSMQTLEQLKLMQKVQCIITK